MSTPEERYADEVVRVALQAATGGLDGDRVAEVVANTLEAINKQAEALKAATYRPEDYERIARAMAHAMKSADGLYRLVEFARGRPGSRPDLGGEWLRALSDQQLGTIQGWVEANAKVDRTEPAEGASGAFTAPEPRGRRSAI